jgi:hypothetical protein
VLVNVSRSLFGFFTFMVLSQRIFDFLLSYALMHSAVSNVFKVSQVPHTCVAPVQLPVR